MVKTVKIGDKTYDLKSSAYTMFAYKDETGNDLMEDINALNKKVEELGKNSDKWLIEIMPIVEKTLKLAYIMIKEQKKDFMEYNKWLKELDGLLDETSWILDVLEVGISPFRRGIQSAPKQ